MVPSVGDPCRSFPSVPFFCKLTVGCFWAQTLFRLSKNSLLVMTPNPLLSKNPCPLSPWAHLHVHPSDLLGHQGRAPKSQSWKEPQASLCMNSACRGDAPDSDRATCAHLWDTVTHPGLWSPRRLVSLWGWRHPLCGPVLHTVPGTQ